MAQIKSLNLAMSVLDSSYIKALGVKSPGHKKIFLIFSDTLFTKIKPRMSSITQTKTDKIKSMITFQEQASDEHEVNPADMLAVSYNNE